MDMLSFATGLAIGKKKYGGSSEYYDPVYHDILQNHLPIYTYHFGTHFKWVLGAWLARESRLGIRDNGLDHIYEVNDTETGKVAAIECYRQTLYTIGIIYKDNMPKYATLLNYVSNPSEAWGHWWVADTKTALFYKRFGDFRLEEVESFQCEQFEPDFSWGDFSGHFNSRITCVINTSYQSYTYNDTAGRVEKDGNRSESSSTLSYYLSNYIYPYPRLDGGFSDLDINSWREIMHELTDEIYTTAGYSKLNYRILPTPV